MMAAMVSKQMLRLSQLLQGLLDISVEADRDVSGISNDTRRLINGDVFIAVRGQTGDASRYIDAAIAAGCSAVLWEAEEGAHSIPIVWRGSPTHGRVPLIACPSLSHLVGVIADRFYGEPSKQLRVIGVTGTNGKTSCTQFIAQSIASQHPCGVIGTLGYGLYGELAPASHTTPDALTCHQLLASNLAQGAHEAVMEVSSHALDQHRVGGIRFHTAVFTNLTHDHLDYHGDMERYGQAKRRLFRSPGLLHAVINADDAYGRQLIAETAKEIRVLSYGLQKNNITPDLYATDIELHSVGIKAVVHTPQGTGILQAPVLGRFNLSNLLAALGVMLSLDWSLSDALAALARVSTVPGRMERLGGGNQPLVVVDYAHTPDALEQVLHAAREHTEGALWCVFGCGGDRDKAKRPVMGAIAHQLADHVVVTTDNPRHEEPQQIISEILSGISDTKTVQVEEDRQSAIRSAIAQAKRGDVIVVAGKGHEDYQQFGDERLPFSDIHAVQQVLMGMQHE